MINNKLLPIIAFLILALGACGQIKEMNERLDEHEARISELENLVKEMNGQIATIQDLLNGKYFVCDVTGLEDGSGYKLVLVDADGKTVEKTVLNGEDGDTPLMGLRQDPGDACWYWTVNGEWLLSDGERVRANGEDGQTPQITLEDGKWYVTVGGVKTFAGDAVTEAKSLVTSIDYISDPRNVIFTLADGAVFSVPRSASARKLQLIFDESAFANVTGGSTINLDYEVIAPEGITYSLSSYEPAGWTVAISPEGNGKGVITVIIPEGARSGKILFALNGSDGSCFVRIVEVGISNKEQYVLDSTGGSVAVEGADSLSLLVQSDWVSVKGNTVTLLENDGYDSRTVTLSYVNPEGETVIVIITQAQKNAIVISASQIAAAPEGETIPFVVKANVKVDASSDAAWLTVTPSSKGLVEKPFSLTAEANDTGAERRATVTFSCGDISQSVIVTQAVKTITPIVSGSGTFVLVTDASDLQDGDRIIIVSEDSKYALGQQSNTNYRDAEKVTVSDNTITEPDEAIAIITLEAASNVWRLSVEGGYLSATSGDKNYLKTVSQPDSHGSWSISISGGLATIKAESGSKNQICFNSASNAIRFSCYGSVSGQVKMVSIYREDISSYLPSEDPILAKDVYGCYVSGVTRAYVRGTDQLLRFSGAFGILDPETNEQLVLTGLAAEPEVGEAVAVSLNWRKGLATVISKNYRMYVAKVEDRKVWIGDGRGNGFIVKK